MIGAFLRGLFRAPGAVPDHIADAGKMVPANPQGPASAAAPTEADLLRQAMNAAGLTDHDLRAGIAAIAMGESNMRGYTERGYSGTGNARIRQVFGSRVAGLSDADLDALKRDDRLFFERVYGGEWGRKNLGNVALGDGYRFRGRGFIQLTGRGNYARYGGMIGKRGELLDNPDLANDPAISAALTVAYIKDRYKGGGFEAMMRCVGNNTADIAATKRRYFLRFSQSGEFDAR